MRYYILTLFFFFVLFSVNAQVEESKPSKELLPFQKKEDSIAGSKKKKVKKEAKPISIEDYKIISKDRDTTFLDTTLTISKEYKYNFLREDDFELMPFSNIGQAYNLLGVNLENSSLYPKIGASARHYGFFEDEDVYYYNVPTPMTELFFKTTLEQGQLLDALLTFNTSPRLNFSIAYSGFRSAGKYRFEQAQSGRFRTSFNYRTANNRYWLRGHYASQDIEAEESGGLLDKETQFESGSEEFLDRSRIDLVYTNADNRVLSKRYFIDHQFNLVRPRKDSVKTKSTLLAIGHQFNYESKFYQFDQTAQDDTFGQVFISPVADRARLKTMFNQVSANFSNKTLGSLSGNINLYNYQYFFNSLLIREDETIQNKLEGDEIALGADYKNTIGKLSLKGKVRYNLSGDLTGTLFDGAAKYQLNENNSITASIHGSSRAPNFNFLLYQSEYQNFNWQNNELFEKQQIQTLAFGFNSKLFGNFEAKYSAIDNYTFFGIDSTITEEDFENGIENAFVRPEQETSTINYLKVKYNIELVYKKWALNNTFMYQNVTQDNQVLNLPEFVTRNTLYYSSDVFKKAMHIQTGVTFKYFTSYNMNGYHPLLGEFYVQNREELGAYPLIDFFINAKVRQTRIYLKAEHINTIWSKEYNYYSAPNYPYRDFVIRFGLVWNFFS
ncbi:putative porin [Croceitalea rosinachiae]|uniref:Porin n=1 Tax=Croceitalea rosinachiae TaxID=3075596 RepID=A0ABU3A9M3_9FLAO|nr:putative porin [Croceitalea sp. F388]MDT0606896.1 putative porin [Croceitalea sp. F388]